MVFAEVAQRAFAGDGLQPPHAAGDAALFQNLDQPDLAGGSGVRAAAQLGGEVADADDAHAVAVLLAEERHRLVLVDGDVDGHVLDDLDAIVAQDFLVGEVFDVLQLLVVERGEVREVEAQVAGIDQRARLLDVRAQHIAQRGVEQVRAGVVAHYAFSVIAVNLTYDLIACLDRVRAKDALSWSYCEDIYSAYGGFASENVRDNPTAILRPKDTAVADLSPCRRVEGSFFENNMKVAPEKSLGYAVVNGPSAKGAFDIYVVADVYDPRPMSQQVVSDKGQ